MLSQCYKCKLNISIEFHKNTYIESKSLNSSIYEKEKLYRVLQFRKTEKIVPKSESNMGTCQC